MMLCPKCKNEVADKTLKCSNCGARIGYLCKDCGAFNLITAKTCANCGRVLIVNCPECNSANLPESKICRKCGHVLKEIKNTDLDMEKPEYTTGSSSQQIAKNKLVEGIKSVEHKIITLFGESGIGKNVILRASINELKGTNLIWLMGTCTQATQLTPFGYFQDLLLTFFNINNYCPDTLQLKKNSIKFFKQDFPTLSNEEIQDLLNLLYPENTDKYENIYFNKVKTFNMMKKVISTIVEKMKVIFIIDKFEFLDGMSFDFIGELLKDETILNRSKFVFLYTVPKPGRGIISSPLLSEGNYLDISVAPFTKYQTEEFLKAYSDVNFTKDIITKIDKIACGVPAKIEQIALLQREMQENNIPYIEFNDIETVIEKRLDFLRNEDWQAYRFLVCMSVLGVKFYPAVLEKFDNVSQDEFERVINKLLEKGFITVINNLSYEFRSDDVWKSVVSYVKNDENFAEILNSLYTLLDSYKQSSIALLGHILQKLNNDNDAFEVWTTLMKQASYIGDIGLYIIAQKQSLKLIEDKDGEFYTMVKRNIYTRVGKLLEPIDSKSAMEYLQNAIMLFGDNDDSEEVELLGYIASCTMKEGNYFGTIECIDRALSKIPKELTFERVIIKSRTIAPLLRLGNYGELIQSVENDILPEIERVLSKGKRIQAIELPELFNLWVELYFCLAEALAFQGNNRVFEVIQTIYEILEKNNSTTPVNICKTNLLLALANTIKGDISASKKILSDMLKEYSLDSMNNFIVSRWNFIDILNKFFEKDYDTLKSELFNVAAYANNVNDSFTKNMLKTILAEILYVNNQTKKALEILDEQVSYFAGEKVATGVLLSWYLIAKIKMQTNFTSIAYDIATKALDIAQGTNICNYYMTAMFNKLLGEIYIAKQDFDSAKIYLEKALFIAKQFDLQYISVKTYLQCARLYQELALPKTNSRGSYIKQELLMFRNAKNVPIVSEQPALQKEIKEDLNILTSFCKLNGISLKKETKSE